MPRNSKSAGGSRDPRLLVRIVLGLLLAADVAAAVLILFPPGGSAEDLQRQMTSLQSQISSKTALLDRTRQHLAAVEKGRNEGDRFLSTYFLASRTAYLTLLGELNEAAGRSKIKPRESSYAVEPIEGSDTLNMLTITYNLDGAYNDVRSFVHELDRSPRLLIIESLSAAPQQGTNVLSVSMKIDTFVRDDATAPAARAPAADSSPRQALAPPWRFYISCSGVAQVGRTSFSLSREALAWVPASGPKAASALKSARENLLAENTFVVVPDEQRSRAE